MLKRYIDTHIQPNMAILNKINRSNGFQTLLINIVVFFISFAFGKVF
jgi:hypothetical protein